MVKAIEAKLAIHELHARYTDAFFRKSEEDYRQCWTADGEWIAFGRSTAGREEIVAFWRTLMKDRHRIWHAPQAVIVDVQGDRATGRVYVGETVTATNGTPRTVLGIYHDRYALDGDRWRFARRWWSLAYLGPADMSGRYWETAPMGSPPHFASWDAPNTPTLAEVSDYTKTLG